MKEENFKNVNLFVKTGTGRKKLTLSLKPKAEIKDQPEIYYENYAKATPEQEREIKVLPQGIPIPDSGDSVEVQRYDKTELDIRNINIKYPLVQINGKVFAFAHIFFDKKSNDIIYNVIEPQLDQKMLSLLEEIKEYLQEKIDINFSYVRKKEAHDYIEKLFDKSLDYFRKRFQPETRDVLKYYIMRDFIGLEKIEPLLSDKNIEDISCDGTGIGLFVYHRNPLLGSLKTNVVFKGNDELDSFVNKLAERCGSTISVSKPLLDGTLPDGSRVQITLATDIARRGSNFTIRMFTEEPINPVSLLKFGTADIKALGYLWFLIENGMSLLISGGTATGKTSLLNALSLFIKPQMKIVSIEDTAELRLPHSHWLPEVARTSIATTVGEVDMFELLRESLRQRPDYIIVGEVRGREAYVLFQQIAVGHPGLATIHADNMQKLVDRLTSPPISLPAMLLQNLDIIIFIKRVKIGRKYVRRIQSVSEILGVDGKTSIPITNEILKWDPKLDKYVVVNTSQILKKLSYATGMEEQNIKDELKKRYRILKWMADKNIIDYKKISYVLNLFYTSPDALLERLGGYQ